MNRMMAVSPHFTRRLVIVSALIVLAAGVALGIVVALQPATANRMGYALPGPHGLPDHFTYQGATYADPGLCAGDPSCANAQTIRWSQTMMAANRAWPLRQVATLPTLFGAGHPIYEPVNDISMIGQTSATATPFLLFIQDPATPGWYFLYQRPGGP